jgi:hypothetical protein
MATKHAEETNNCTVAQKFHVKEQKYNVGEKRNNHY